ncbi:MAG: NAD-dependent epimerase/dehydratase family protein [Bacteroidota bacterium]|nr:NAD-dependent epimerase/dehydratase family protein [Bacteroidota bacterium]MDP4229584.1 NAD-dependent epimerase/dehydratase family protein [Bacteroidota bacterium]MDP4236979.1 NAD-dependent epimerase/dehydratase family protein [Bacteroidota bacterium]
MKIIIVGRGEVGSSLSDALTEFDIHPWTMDIDDLTSAEIERIHPDAIINAAGKTDLKWCEENPRETFRCNIEAPVRLYQRITTHNSSSVKPIRFLHFSSGCIWDGPYDATGKPFTPLHPARPAVFYSWTKAAADQLLLAEDPTSVAILRPRQIYSARHTTRNTISKLITYPGLVTTPNSMTSMEVIIKTVRFCLVSKDNWNGVWNIYDPGVTTPFEVGKMLAEAGLRKMPAAIEKSELDAFHKPRRVDTVLYDDRFEKVIRPEPFEQVIKRTIAQFKSA